MTWDISAGRIRAGLTAGDTSADTQIQLAMDQALALAELYCHRHFMYAEQTETFVAFRQKTISLQRYPLDDFVSAEPTLDAARFTPLASADPLVAAATAIGLEARGTEAETGLVYLMTPPNWKSQKITYKGGYRVLPADLEMALWMIFDATKAAAAGATGSLGGVKRASLTGVGSVDFDLGSSAATGGGGLGGFMSPAATSILDLYVRERV